MRGATLTSCRLSFILNISIHAPRAGSDAPISAQVTPKKINFNPRSPCGERLRPALTLGYSAHHFNPRSPCGERRAPCRVFPAVFFTISIHAPRAGSDVKYALDGRAADDFNPRSPCGERLSYASISLITHSFQSTLPVRGATSMHLAADLPLPQFQSTLPVRGATSSLRPPINDLRFQSTLPVRGATWP